MNHFKYIIIFLLGITLYEYWRKKSDLILYPIIFSLLIVWFADFDAAYRWDAIQHVARAKYFMNHDIITFFFSGERSSFVYLIWAFIYHIFAESEVITNLTNMIFGLLGIFGIYTISKDIYGKFEAILAVIISLTLPTIFLINTWAYLDSIFVTFVIFSMVFIVKYIKTSKCYFLWLSLFFAFLSTGSKEPGILLFLIIFMIVFYYNRTSINNLLSIGIGSFFGLILLLNTIQFFLPYIGTYQKELSIITPFSYGFDAMIMWISLLNQEILLILSSGLLFLSILPFFQSRKSNFFYISIFISQVITLCWYTFFPSNSIFFFPVIPYQNYVFYYIPITLVIGATLLCLYFKKITLNWSSSKKSILFLFWAFPFIFFFMVNSKMNGYGINAIMDVPLLDFRYLMPALPALIILFSKGVEVVLTSEVSSFVKKTCILLVSAIIITNLIMSFNLTFFFTSSGDIHLEGYKAAENLTDTGVIYSHWPFAYFPNENVMDIGEYNWNTANMSFKSIYRNEYQIGSAILFNSHFFKEDSLQYINITTIESNSIYSDPIFPYVSIKKVDTVSFGKISYPVYELGSVIFFGKNGTSKKFQSKGWSQTEKEHTWTNGQISSLVLHIMEIKDDISLKVVASPYVSKGSLEYQKVNVFVNGQRIDEWIFDKPVVQEKIAKISHKLLKEGIQNISFELPNSSSPKLIEGLEDERNLGIAVRSIVIEN